MWHALECQFEGIRREFKVLIWFIIFEEKPSNFGCNVVITDVVVEDMGARDNGAKAQDA
jgi:hypothetical protein